MREFDEADLLERSADRLRAGDQVFTPAHRWETVETVERSENRLYMQVTTRAGRKVCRWRFEVWKTYPVLSGWYTNREPKARLWVSTRSLMQVIAAIWDYDHDVHKGYHLAAAYGKRGQGWEVYDYGAADPAAPVAESLSKARAVALVKKIARARAVELGVGVDFAGRDA